MKYPAAALFVTLVSFEVAKCAPDELNGVVVIFRHGDRTPVKPYPTDPYKNRSFWPVDFGQLTNKGKHEEFELGQWLRQRYDSFLPKIYDEKDLYVRSTDVDRTLMSAEANLAGLYPPIKQQIWEKTINWQPIAIHTVPELLDNVLSAKKPCPKYERLYADLFKTEFFTNITRKHHDLFAYLTRNSGETILTLETLEYLYNTLLIESIYNLTLPVWAQKVFPKKLEALAFLSFATATYTQELSRLKVGPLFHQIIEYFHNKTYHKYASPKLVLLSGHDVTIANVLNSMGAFEYHSPPYAAAIIFELRKRNNGRDYVRIFYKNTSEARPVQMHNCDSDCDLMDFVTVLKPITLSADQWEAECRLKLSFNFSLDTVTLVIGATAVVSILILILAAVFGKWKQKEDKKYVQLPNEEYA